MFYATCTRCSCLEGSSCIFHALENDGEGIGANALCQSTAVFFSDQPKYAVENVPLEDLAR
jgi:hypothetical protein